MSFGILRNTLIEEKSIICILTSKKHDQYVLELKDEEPSRLLQDEIQRTSDVITLQRQPKFLLMNVR